MIQQLIPLCSSQYERQFSTVRLPGKETGQSFDYFHIDSTNKIESLIL